MTAFTSKEETLLIHYFPIKVSLPIYSLNEQQISYLFQQLSQFQFILALLHNIYNYIMEEKNPNPNNTDLEKVPSRRSRKDEDGRDFLCGCGKRYLSYPALYTHIKTKHNGCQPQGTLKTGTNAITRRNKGRIQQDGLKCIIGYFNKQDLRIFSQIQEGLTGFVPLSSRIKKDNVPKQTYEQYMSLVKEKEIKLSSSSSLDLALIAFLINVGIYVNDKIYEQFLNFAKFARSCYFEHGQQIYRAYYSKKDLGGAFVLPNFTVNEVKYFPIIADFLIQLYIPSSQAKQNKDINISLMELITYDFCNWLHLHKFTMIKTSISKDFKLDFKPIIIIKQKGTPHKTDNNKEPNSKEHRQQNQDQSQDISENEDIPEEEEAQKGKQKESEQ